MIRSRGVPQGGVLSTTLFNIKINDIVKCLDNLTDCSLYVDDFCICFQSKSMRTIERHLQQNLNKIEDWATNDGFKFSKSKTQCVHFCLPGRVAQSVTCLATDACLTADPGVASSIPVRSHTFVEIDHEMVSTVILLPSADSFKKGCCQLQAKVCARITG